MYPDYLTRPRHVRADTHLVFYLLPVTSSCDRSSNCMAAWCAHLGSYLNLSSALNRQTLHRLRIWDCLKINVRFLIISDSKFSLTPTCWKCIVLWEITEIANGDWNVATYCYNNIGELCCGQMCDGEPISAGATLRWPCQPQQLPPSPVALPGECWLVKL